MNEPLADISENPSPHPAGSLQQGSGRQLLYVTGFAGPRLRRLDNAVLAASAGFYFIAVFFFLGGGAVIWFCTLIAIIALGVCDAALLHVRGQALRLSDRTIRRFMYCLPFNFFCLYGQAVIHKSKHCKWYIAVGPDWLRALSRVGTYSFGSVAVFSLALAALRMDCNGSPGVSKRVYASRWYTTCHLLFRFSELSFRLGAGVFVCECLRVLPMAQEIGPPLFLCIPFLCLICIYALALQTANQAGGKPLDGVLTCFVVGVVMLALNPTHFFARPGYEAAARKANKILFVIRFLELLAALGFIFESTHYDVPKGCEEGYDSLELMQQLGSLALCQVVVSLAVHYLIMALHSEIQHSTCQALSEEQGGAAAQLAFPRPDVESLYVPPPPADAGLGQAWLQLGGGLPLFSIAERMAPAVMDRYRIRKILGGGTFGVVVQVEPVGSSEAVQAPSYAMKLLNTGDRRNARLAQREVEIYGTIWLQCRELAANLQRVGHPNIVRLLFWTDYDSAREFYMQDEARGEVLVHHPQSRTTKFHMALMMEYCETNLEAYLSNNFRPGPPWLSLIVHFLAQILLALEFLHSTADVAYRDLKPENVLVVRRSNTKPEVHCKLGDFGYGRHVDPEAGRYQVSVAGTPYFCALEMEERVKHHALNANPTEEKALDIYSFGTVAYVLAHGPGYVMEPKHKLTGDRVDHPRCQTVANSRCGRCKGCELLKTLGRNLRGWNVPSDIDKLLIMLIGQCVERRNVSRPTAAQLHRHALFSKVDFDGLLRLDI